MTQILQLNYTLSMTTITFDTLKFSERLINSGMPEKQAKALAEAQAEINEANWRACY